jgi:hypothetical protein
MRSANAPPLRFFYIGRDKQLAFRQTVCRSGARALCQNRSTEERAVGDIVNLNKFRKRKAKLQRQKRAETNRRLHGRTKAERTEEELAKKRLSSRVDGARLERPEASAEPTQTEPATSPDSGQASPGKPPLP